MENKNNELIIFNKTDYKKDLSKINNIDKN